MTTCSRCGVFIGHMDSTIPMQCADCGGAGPAYKMQDRYIVTDPLPDLTALIAEVRALTAAVRNVLTLLTARVTVSDGQVTYHPEEPDEFCCDPKE